MSFKGPRMLSGSRLTAGSSEVVQSHWSILTFSNATPSLRLPGGGAWRVSAGRSVPGLYILPYSRLPSNSREGGAS